MVVRARKEQIEVDIHEQDRYDTGTNIVKERKTI